MRSGRLRHLVSFESLTITQDSDGATEEAWLPAFDHDIRAEITPLSGKELVAAQAVQSKVSARMKVRYRTGFVPSMRAVHRGTIYNIEAVLPDPDSGFQWVTLLCSYGVNEG